MQKNIEVDKEKGDGSFKRKADGSLIVRFRYWQNGKLKSVPNKSLKAFYTEEEVISALPALEAKYDYEKLRLKRIEDWRYKYSNFEILIKEYEDWAKTTKAKRSYKGKVGHLKNYILPYFLGTRGQNNMNIWPDLFKDFVKHLQTINSHKHTHKKLKENTINNIINELNVFLERMNYLGECNLARKCEIIAGAKERSKHTIDNTFSDIPIFDTGLQRVIAEDEKLYEYLVEKDQLLADAFWLLLKTGMRIREFRGLNISNVRQGKIPNLNLERKLVENGLGEYNCYIFFNSQVSNKSNIRDKDGKIKYIPMKSKKGDEPKENDTRFVPILDARAEEIIHKYLLIAADNFQKRLHGDSLDQYPFFYEVTGTMLNNHLNSFYDKEENKAYKRKSCHSARHTFATWLGGQAFDISGFDIQRLILGHQQEAAERYCHVLGKMRRDAITSINNPLGDFNFDLKLKKTA